MSGEIKENVTRRGIWLRLCFMIIMSFAFSVAEVIIFAVVAFQFLSSLFVARTNDQLIRLGRNLARYLQQITAYLTFATEEVPFPFMSWPDEPHDEAPEEEDGNPPDDTLNDTPDDMPDDTLNDIAETNVEAGGGHEADSAVMADSPVEPVEEDGGRVDEERESAGVGTGETRLADAPATEPLDRPDETPATAGAVVEEGLEEGTKAADTAQTAVFADGDAYQKFMGERSRLGGERLVKMLGLPPRLSWLDVGCGTGALSAVIMEHCDPSALIGIDSSEAQITLAATELGSANANFRVGDATQLPFEVDSFDAAVSSYVLNFVPDKQKMVDEMARVVRPEGTVAASVFDHAGGRMAAHPFWELIGKNDAAFREAEFEKRGWNSTHPEALTAFFENAGLENVSVDTFEIDETFTDFDEYWIAMTSLPTSGMSVFVNGLDQDERDRFMDDLKSLLPTEPDGRIKLVSGSWVARGMVPA